MTVVNIGILALAALVIGQLGKRRELALLGVSVFVVYWLQPPQGFVSLVYWMPTATIALTGCATTDATTTEDFHSRSPRLETEFARCTCYRRGDAGR